VKFARFHLNLSSQSCILGYCSGKVILAASFHSGNIQAFSYGPHPTPSLPPQSGLISTSKLSHLDDRIYAWGLPSKVVAPRASPNNWATILDSSMDFFQQEYNKAAPSKRTWDHLAGLVLLPRDFQKVHRLETQDDCRGFSLMQLTGEGNILAQHFQAAERLHSVGSRVSPTKSSDADPTGACYRVWQEFYMCWFYLILLPAGAKIRFVNLFSYTGCSFSQFDRYQSQIQAMQCH
jgi:hypothetical protein